MKMVPLKRKRRANRNKLKEIRRANCLPQVQSRKGPTQFTKALQSLKLKRTCQGVPARLQRVNKNLAWISFMIMYICIFLHIQAYRQNCMPIHSLRYIKHLLQYSFLIHKRASFTVLSERPITPATPPENWGESWTGQYKTNLLNIRDGKIQYLWVWWSSSYITWLTIPDCDC